MPETAPGYQVHAISTNTMRIPFPAVLILVAVGSGTVVGQDGPSPGASSAPSRVHIGEIVGAGVEGTGLPAAVAAYPSQRTDRRQFRFVRFRQDGTPGESVLIGEDDSLQSGHKAILLGGRLRFSWIDPGKGILIASVQGGKAKVETLLGDDDAEGPMGDFWAIEFKGRPRLFVTKYRSVDPDGRPSPGRQYTWLYSYALEKGAPRLAGKARVEDAKTRSADMACAANGDEVIVWQTVHEKGSPVATIRFARWKDDGRLEWKERYSGNDSLGLLVDVSCGSACLAQEWKSPEDASGILCVLRRDVAQAIPVGTYGGRYRQRHVRFARLANPKLWAVASKGPEGLSIAFFHDDLTHKASIRVDGKGITDYALATSQDVAYVVLLQHGSLSARGLRVEPGRSGAGTPGGERP